MCNSRSTHLPRQYLHRRPYNYSHFITSQIVHYLCSRSSSSATAEPLSAGKHPDSRRLSFLPSNSRAPSPPQAGALTARRAHCPEECIELVLPGMHVATRCRGRHGATGGEHRADGVEQRCVLFWVLECVCCEDDVGCAVGVQHQFCIVESSKLYMHRRGLLGTLVTNPKGRPRSRCERPSGRPSCHP